MRHYDGETVLVVNNLSGSVQIVEVDLGQFRGVTPIELVDKTVFPFVGEQPYTLSLGPHRFYWLRLQR
ncbi:MAG: alpha-glucosidase C-terminal domain-containing protein [Candidatus Binatia bacterium]